jgi:Pectinacetylesterase
MSSLRLSILGSLVVVSAACGPAAEQPCALADGGACPTAIVADAGTWTWVDFPDSACGNGQPTGLAVNPGPGATDLVLYLEGGGACWDALTCFTLGTAVHVTDGYTATTFASERSLVDSSIFDRTLAGNPFSAASFAFIPYCTGDVHAGDSVQSYPGAPAALHHHGARNVEAFLARLRLTFPASRVYLTGSSAGAYGAQLNYAQVAAAFPSAELHVLADSGQMINPSGSLLATWLQAWNVSLPAACTGCSTDFPKYPAYLATTFPASRFALLAYTQDLVLSTFFSRTASDFQAQTLALLASAYDGHANAHYFVLAGATHTMLGEAATLSAPGGPTLLQFLSEWKTGDAAWASVKP